MGIYKITFTHDFSEFENCIQIPDYDEAQNYFKANADDRKCLLVAKKKSRLYMVIYYEQKKVWLLIPGTIEIRHGLKTTIRGTPIKWATKTAG